MEDSGQEVPIPPVHLLPASVMGRITPTLAPFNKAHLKRRKKGHGHPQGGIFFAEPAFSKIGWDCDSKTTAAMRTVLRVINALKREGLLPLPFDSKGMTAAAVSLMDVGAGSGVFHLEKKEGGDAILVIHLDGKVKYWVVFRDPTVDDGEERWIELEAFGAMYALSGGLIDLITHKHETAHPKRAIRVGFFLGTLAEKAARPPSPPRPLIFFERGNGRSERDTPEHHGTPVPNCLGCDSTWEELKGRPDVSFCDWCSTTCCGSCWGDKMLPRERRTQGGELEEVGLCEVCVEDFNRRPWYGDLPKASEGVRLKGPPRSPEDKGKDNNDAGDGGHPPGVPEGDSNSPDGQGQGEEPPAAGSPGPTVDDQALDVDSHSHSAGSDDTVLEATRPDGAGPPKGDLKLPPSAPILSPTVYSVSLPQKRPAPGAPSAPPKFLTYTHSCAPHST
jgi:hypothetical protein